ARPAWAGSYTSPARVSPAVTRLEQGAAGCHAIRAVRHPGRAAGVHACRERLTSAEVDHVAVEDPDFFPEVVRDRLCRLDTRIETEEPCEVAGLGIEAQDLFAHATAAGTGARGADDLAPREMTRTEELQVWLRHGAHP